MQTKNSFHTTALRLCLAIFGLLLTGTISRAVMPPALPAETHIPVGCYIDAVAYIAKLKTKIPGAEAMTYDVSTTEAHTITLVISDGTVYGRDEFFGVFEVGKVPADINSTSYRKQVTAALDRHAKDLRARGQHVETLSAYTFAMRERYVSAAAKMIPGSAVFHVGKEPVLYFVSGGISGVYSPKAGTAHARILDAKRLNAEMAVQLAAGALGLTGTVAAK